MKISDLFNPSISSSHEEEALLEKFHDHRSRPRKYSNTSYGSSHRYHSSSSYVSFPAPRSGRSPTIPVLKFPRYNFICDSVKESRSTDVPEKLKLSMENNNSKLSVFGATAHASNFFMGIAILILPFALKLTGWSGLIVLFTLEFIMSLTGKMIGDCQNKLSLESLTDLAELAYGTKGRILVACLFCLRLIFEIALYLLILANSLEEMSGINRTSVMWVSTLVFIVLTNLVRTTPHITSWLNILETVSTLVLSVVLILFVTLDLAAKVASAEKSGNFFAALFTRSTEKTVFYTNFNSFLSSIGLFSFSFMGHSIFPSVFHNMKKPNKYASVVNCTFLVMATFYTLIASLGYIAYGQSTTGNIIKCFTYTSPRSGPQLTTQALVGHYLAYSLLILTVTAKASIAAAPLAECLHEWLQFLCCRADTFEQWTDGASVLEDPIYRSVMHHRWSSQQFPQVEDSPPTVELGIPTRPTNLMVDLENLNTGDFEFVLFDLPSDSTELQSRSELKEETGLFSDGSMNQNVTTSLDTDFSSPHVGVNQPAETKSSPGELSYQACYSGAASGDDLRSPPKLVENIRWTFFTKAFLTELLIRSSLPLVALGITRMFQDITVLMAFIGGIFGVAFSVLIPIACYRQIVGQQRYKGEEIVRNMPFSIGVTAVIGVFISFATIYSIARGKYYF